MTTLVAEDVRTEVRSGLLGRSWTKLAGLALAAAALLAVVAGSLLIGNLSVTAADVSAVLGGTVETDAERAVRYVRIPRTLAGVLAGVALGLAGMIMQGLTRNSLADPGLLGINAGASLAVVLAISALSITTPSEYLWFAFAGATVSAVAVYALGAIGFGGATPVKLALAGSAFAALQGAIVSMLILRSSSTTADFRFWVVGSLNRADDSALIAVAPFIAVGVVLSVALTRTLNVLALGDDLATTLGTRLAIARVGSAVAVVLLAGAATALTGPIGFVGLVVPHIARMICGPDYRWVLAWTVLLGPMLLLLADIMGRVVVRPEQLQVGIVTALVGGPFFLYLVRNRKVAGV